VSPAAVLRVVRPSDNLSRIVPMYVRGLGFTVLHQFTDHEGFDGAILGHAKHPYHFAFVAQHGHRAGTAPTKEHLLVFFLPDRREWESTCTHMLDAGFHAVPSNNPYWDRNGRTFEDVDGYRVVLQNGAWEE
jgi:hypothetical protein